PVSDDQDGDVLVAGSPRREAAIALVGDGERGSSQVYSGPAGGPLAPFGEPVAVAGGVLPPHIPDVAGDHLLVVELGPTSDEIRYRIDGGAPFTLPGVIQGFAGDLVAYYEDTRGLVLRNWRTGAERAVAVSPIEFLDLRADGAAAAQPE